MYDDLICRGYMFKFNHFLVVCLLLIISVQGQTKKVLIIGIDGVRPDCLKFAQTPTIDLLAKNGTFSENAYSGGELNTKTQQPTVSGPGWISILSGNWMNRHGVKANNFKGYDHKASPHFFKRIKDQKPDLKLSSICQWHPINENILKPVVKVKTMINTPDKGASVKELALEDLKNNNPDVVFVHFDDVDHAGHKHGYGKNIKPYVTAIEQTDKHIGELIAQINSHNNESWLVLITTDHGGINKGHGGQSPDERRVFVLASGGDVMKNKVVEKGPGITVIAPTAFKHLELKIDNSWDWPKPFGYK